jgi:hypothetical protein
VELAVTPVVQRAVNVVVATIPLSGQPLVVVFAPDGTPWVGRAETGSRVIEIDPATNTIRREVLADVGLAAASESGALWFGSSSTLTRIDPVADQITATIATGSPANAVSFGEGAVWTTDYSGRPTTMQARSFAWTRRLTPSPRGLESWSCPGRSPSVAEGSGSPASVAM